jgi:hypothetical protein
MAWQVIAEGNSIEEFEASTTTEIVDLPKGTRLRYRVEVPIWAPIGKLADLAGVEFLAQYFGPAGIDVDDVYGNWHWMEVRATVDPPLAPLTAVAVIILALAALGIAWYISRIILEADIGALIITGVAIGVGVALAGGLALLLLGRKSKGKVP